MTFDPRTHCTPHLSWRELACHDVLATPYPLDWRETRGRRLGQAFEQVRAAVGVPLEILSGYRTSLHNRRVGGAENSQHVAGRAVDIACPRGMAWDAFVAAVRKAAALSDVIRGLGLYPSRGFAHVDVREAPTLVQWTA